MPKNTLIVSRLDGGLNTKVSSVNLHSSESPLSKNVVFDDVGSVETTKGRTAINASLGDYPIQGLASFTDSTSNTHLIAACGGSLYQKLPSDEFQLIANASGLYDTDNPIFMLPFKDKLFISDGEGEQYKFNGTTLTKWGIDVPNGAMSATSYSTGVLSGTYQYAVFGENEYNARGDYGTVSPITVTNTKVNLSNIPVFPEIDGVSLKYICRSKVGSSLLYLVGSIANNITSYTDNTPDASLTEEAPIDNGRPPALFSFVTIKGLMFGLTKNSSKLYFSNLEDPEVWSSADYLRISNGDGLYCTGLSVLSDAVVVSKNKTGGDGTFYHLFMPSSDDTNWSLQKVDSRVGGQAPKAMVPFSNSIMMLNRFGIWDISQTSPGMIRPDAISFNIEAFINQLSLTDINRATAINWNNKLYVSVPYGQTSTSNNMLLIYDYVKGRDDKSRKSGAWSYLSNTNLNDFAVHENNLYAGDSTATGLVYKLETGYNYNDDAIVSMHQTAPLYGRKGEEGYSKVWRTVWVLVDNVGDWDMQLNANVDFQYDVNNQVLTDINPSGAWGTLVWGSGVWGTPPSYDWTGTEYDRYTDSTLITLELAADTTKSSKWVRYNLKNCVGKYISFTFLTATADEWFRVRQLKVEYWTHGRQR